MARKPWSEEQKQAARERMAHARKSLMNNATVMELPPTIAQKPPRAMEPTETSDQPDLVLTVRRLKVGSFMGLWELGQVMPDGSIKLLTDANTKAIVINLARNAILRCGI